MSKLAIKSYKIIMKDCFLTRWLLALLFIVDHYSIRYRHLHQSNVFQQLTDRISLFFFIINYILAILRLI